MLGLLSDLLLVSATLGLAFWCRILSQRLRPAHTAEKEAGPPSVTPDIVEGLKERLIQLDSAIAVSASQVADRVARMEEMNRQADDRIGRMEMLLASLEDLEEESADRLLQEEVQRRDTIPAMATMPEERLPSFRAARNAVSGGRN